MTRAAGIFDFADRVAIASLNHRLNRAQIINANIANAETPGYRAIGYDFEDQLQTVLGADEPLALRVSDPKHRRQEFVTAQGEVEPDIFVRPSESVAEDGNTVDMDTEMAQLSKNEILYRTTVETISRKLGTLRYAINGGR